MSVKRVPRPNKDRMVVNTVAKPHTQIMPFYIERIKRNEDLFQITTEEHLKIEAIRINIREMVGGPYRLRIILEARDGILTVESSLKEGSTTIQFPHNLHIGDTLRFDFAGITEVYKNVRGVTGSIILRA